MEKSIKNADAIARKLKLASTRATNDSLKASKEEKEKREEIMKRQKTEALTAKWH